MRAYITIFILIAASAISLTASTTPETMRDARDRMIERLPDMENLWNRGLTGESNEGFVSARSSLNQTQIGMIQSENRDRALLFSFVAEKTGTDMFLVGRERAIQVYKMAKDRLWVQESDGRWVRK